MNDNEINAAAGAQSLGCTTSVLLASCWAIVRHGGGREDEYRTSGKEMRQDTMTRLSMNAQDWFLFWNLQAYSILYREFCVIFTCIVGEIVIYEK